MTHRMKGVTGAAHPAYLTEVTATQALRRVAAKRGAVSELDCRDCGKRARHWVLARVSSEHREADGQQWSGDPADYDPLCRFHRNQRDPNLRPLPAGMQPPPGRRVAE